MFQDIKNQQFHMLTVRNYYGKNNQNKSLWLCDCECGKSTIVTTADLKRGHVKSCGCLQKLTIRKLKTTHGNSYSRLYTIWESMKQRCYNPNSKEYLRYGGRNIVMCEEWRNNFENFYQWSINNNYSDILTIDRIDNDGNYEPNNCRWSTFISQQNNRSNNHYLVYNNERHTVSEWSRILNIPRHKVIKTLGETNDKNRRL